MLLLQELVAQLDILRMTMTRWISPVSALFTRYTITSKVQVIPANIQKSLDVFYDFLIWTSIEPCLGVIGCCLPTMGHLVDLNFTNIYSRLKFSWSQFSLRRSFKWTSPPSSMALAIDHNWCELTGEGSETPRELKRSIVNDMELQKLPQHHGSHL